MISYFWSKAKSFIFKFAVFEILEISGNPRIPLYGSADSFWWTLWHPWAPTLSFHGLEPGASPPVLTFIATSWPKLVHGFCDSEPCLRSQNALRCIQHEPKKKNIAVNLATPSEGGDTTCPTESFGFTGNSCCVHPAACTISSWYLPAIVFHFHSVLVLFLIVFF